MKLYLLGIIGLAVVSGILGGIGSYLRQLRQPSEVGDFFKWWLVLGGSVFGSVWLLWTVSSAFRYWSAHFGSLIP